MSNSKNYWTSQRPDGSWAVKREGAERAVSRHPTQEKAWSETQQRARESGGEAYLRDREGHIRQRNSYGNDPCPPKDKR